MIKIKVSTKIDASSFYKYNPQHRTHRLEQQLIEQRN
jgi:hypothetical protein